MDTSGDLELAGEELPAALAEVVSNLEADAGAPDPEEEDAPARDNALEDMSDDEYFQDRLEATLGQHTADYEHLGLLFGPELFRRRLQLVESQLRCMTQPDVLDRARNFHEQSRQRRADAISAHDLKHGTKTTLLTDECVVLRC